ncbi:hypothetical protein ROZALSC1DRAFT_22904, partial [Rozella allomycis CSF55]
MSTAYCLSICHGKACEYENFEFFDENDKKNLAFPFFNSNWINENVLAMQRPSESLIKQIDLLKRFKDCGIGAIFNLQEPGEHAYCGDGIIEKNGFSYDPRAFINNQITRKDMSTPDCEKMLNIVQIMDDEICKNKKKVAVHCHAGLGNLCVIFGLFQQNQRRCSNSTSSCKEVLMLAIKNRPKALLTNKQCEFIQEFQTFLGQLRLTFPIGTQKIEYSDFLKRQKMILRGKEAIKYKSIPKFLELFVNRIFKETDLGFKNIDDFLVHSKGIDISDERSLLNNQDFKFIEIAKPIKLFTIIDSWLRSLD